MTEKMNPPPLGIKRIRELEELRRVLGVHLKHEIDASPMWNEYVWSFAVDIYNLYYSHYSTFSDFAEYAKDAARHNAAISTVEVVKRQTYNFNAIRDGYERKIFEVITEHIKREEAKRESPKLIAVPIPPNPLGLSSRALGITAPIFAPINYEASRRQAFVQPLLDEKYWSIYDWAQKAGVSHHTASDYYNARRKTQPYNLKKLADALGVSFQNFPK